MPGFSAIIYFFLGVKRTASDDKFIESLLAMKSSKELITLLPDGQVMNQPIPIFTMVDDVEQYRQKFN